ncbi:glycosyltransferase [Anaerobacillus isosaccharinicus]|uniref:Glycosyltransferase n=1 Tax=Anaerobacillus isosaccharinicus TaxID=1532552 RepID=A0A1S2LX92_9BACI|nr:glycosyltransferase [Anaerobacillus isosaccharinicus]MBA5584419.1 glycosyltransferase [Anaerobacillus isosaccharinicus]QOY37190.1 glycosyltransferase [Anaerobacillus isosaccharinicus]
MKIVHVISGGETGGSRKHVVTLLEKFPKEEVTLIVFQEGKLLEEARAAGIDVKLLSQKSRYDLSILKRLTEFVNEGDYDIIHTHGPRANLFGALIKARFKKATWVTTIHSDPKLDFVRTGIKGILFSNLNLWAIKKIDYFFAVSERFKENLVSIGINGEKIKAIFNGIEFNEQLPEPSLSREDLHIPAGALVITMVARLHPIKGHDNVFEALKKIGNQNIHLLLVGDGPIEKELKEKVKSLQLEKQVHFLGFRSDVNDVLQISDLSLLASFSESFPLALLESANMRKPVITTDVGGVASLVSDKTFGWVIPIDDIPTLQAAIEEANQIIEQLPEMGIALYEHASTNFSIEKLYIVTRSEYEQIKTIR